MGLRLSMLHEHSPTNDRPTFTTATRSSSSSRRGSKKELKPFATDQGMGSILYETSVQGPFPTYSVTEDYALSLELRKAGYKVIFATYTFSCILRGCFGF
jgi:cellulose synthase/poly-beta-1,6-N-acetylglucosamine synthase-like glycosyltransferase